MNLTNIEEMQDRLNELMELPKDKFPSVLKLVEDLENLYKENKQQKEVIQTYETLLKTNIEENKQLKEKLETSEKARKEALDIIKLKEYVIDLSTFGYDFNDCEIFKLKRILDIDKGE